MSTLRRKRSHFFNFLVKSEGVWKRVMSVACKYLTPLKPTPNSKVFRNLHCKFKRLNSFSVSVNGHSENAYLRSLWALSCHSLHDHLTATTRTKGEFAATVPMAASCASLFLLLFGWRDVGTGNWHGVTHHGMGGQD
mgnify:CR=1 FL=1